MIKKIYRMISKPLIFIAFSLFYFSALSQTPDTLLVSYTVYQCDSVIQANANNPDFVLLDVRSPAEHIPQHLTGAIMRNYYNSYFSQLIDALPRHKFYLVHCASGGRSGATFNMMQGMNFTHVVNMIGGMGAWNAASLPTTSSFAPMIMSVSETEIPNDDIIIGNTDSIFLTFTNRANDTLQGFSISSLNGTEFSTNFDTTVQLTGSEDYTFSIVYEPIDEISDTLNFMILSNGGELIYQVIRTGLLPTNINENLSLTGISLYPNPTHDKITIDLPENYKQSETFYYVQNLNGQKISVNGVSSGDGHYEADISGLSDGLYIMVINNTSNKSIHKKFIKSR